MINRRGFTVFADNLPQNLDRYGLKGIFNRGGIVSDSYIPPKLGKMRNRFGFVRFWNENAALNSILRLNGSIVRGSRIRVSWARFGKGGLGVGDKEVAKNDLKLKPRKVWCEVRSKDDQAKFNQGDHEVMATVKDESNEFFLEWLSKSVICVSKESWDLEDLSKALVEVGCAKIRVISKFKFILSFHTCEQKDEILENHDKVGKWFTEVKNWDIYEVCGSRRCWIEFFGVSPHGWSLRNFESIASIWEKLVCLETPIEDTLSFESMRILIESNSFQEVGGRIILEIGDAGYRVMVKEASCSFNINPQFIVPEGSSSMMIKATNQGSGAPMRQVDDVASNDDVPRNQWVNENKLDATITDVVVDETPVAELNDGNGQNSQRIGKCVDISCASSSRTKTAHLSGNGFSEEVATIYRCAPSQSEGVNGHTMNGVTQHQLDLGNTKISNGLNHSSNTSELSAPPGFSLHIEKGSGETLVPPGFKGFNASVVKSSHKGKSPKRHLVDTEKRLRRSQTKMRKESGGIVQNTASKSGLGGGTKGGSPQESKSTSNSVSIAKLPKESIEMGKMLGIRVIGNEEDAVKNFTKILKNERAARRQFKAN